MLTAGWIKSGIQQVGNYIQSSNYAAGSSGWYIRSYDGYAEFQNIKARGNIEATSIKAGTVNIIDTLMVRGNAITIPAAFVGPDVHLTSATTYTKLCETTLFDPKGGGP